MNAEDDRLPAFEGAELHLHVAGSIGASLVPWWIHWLRFTSPGVVVNASVSPRAQRFVTPEALREIGGGEVWVDDWTQPELPRSWRSGRTGESECIIVFPATLDTVMRLSQGRASSPALMMMQMSKLPIVIADAIPAENPVIEHWRGILELRENVHFTPRVTGARADDRSTHKNGLNFPGAIVTANAAISAGRTP